MRKLLAILISVAFLSPLSFAYASGETITQSSLYTGHYQFSNNEGSSSNRAYFYSNTTTAHGDVNTYGIPNVVWPGDVDFSSFGHGSYHVLLVSASEGICTSSTYAVCITNIIADGNTYTDYTVQYLATPPPPPTPVPGIGGLVTSANTGFASTTGFSIDSVTTWTANNLLKLFIGSGFALLFTLRYWIVALIVIGAIVYFSYRAYVFFKH